MMAQISPSEKLQVTSSFKHFLLSCFGPGGRAKYVQNTHSALMTLSASSKNLLENLDFISPISRLVAASVLQQVSAYRDNGLYIGIIVTSLVEGAVRAKVHHRICCEVNNLLLTSCLGTLKDISFKVDLSDLEAMLCLVRSIFSSKPSCCLSKAETDFLSSLVLQTLLLSLPDNLPKELAIPHLEYVSMAGHPVTETQLFSGVLLEAPGNFHRLLAAWKKKLGNGHTAIKVALFDNSLAIEKDPLPGVTLEASADLDFQEYAVEQFRTLSSRLRRAGVKLVGCQKVIHPSLVKLLHSVGILAVDRLSLTHIGAVRRLTGACPLSSMNCDITEGSLGSLGDISSICVLDQQLLQLTAASQQNKVTTAVLCHRTEGCLQELKHVFAVAYHAACLAISHPEVVPGAGIFEAWLVATIRGKLTDLWEDAGSRLSCSFYQFSQAAEVFLGSLDRIARSLRLDQTVSDSRDQGFLHVSRGMDLDSVLSKYLTIMDRLGRGDRQGEDGWGKGEQQEENQEEMGLKRETSCKWDDHASWDGKVIDLLVVKKNAFRMGVEVGNLILSIGAVVSSSET